MNRVEVGVILISLVAGVIAGAACLTGCSHVHPEDTKTAADSIAQQAEHAQCRAIGRQRNSYAAYQECADRVDAHYLDGGR